MTLLPKAEIDRICAQIAAECAEAERTGELVEVVAARRDLRLIDRSALDDLPDPEPLITGVLDRRTVTVLAGAPAIGKSFVALSWGLSAATGRPWLGGPPASSGKVLYVAAEGAYGLRERVRAWESRRNEGRQSAPGWFLIRPEPLNLLDEWQVAGLCTYLREDAGFALVVFDTLARCTAGGDENSARDMGLAVDSL